MAIILFNTIHQDGGFISSIVDDSQFPDDIREFFEVYPTGFHFGGSEQTESEWVDFVEETGFDIFDYADSNTIPKQVMGVNAYIDKIINADY